MIRLRAWLLLASALFAPAAGANPDTRVVHEERSLYRNILVLEGEGKRCMVFGRRSGRQGCIDLADPDALALPYFRAFIAALLAQPAPRRVLVIGLGVGVMPRVLQAYDPALRVDVVELDQAVARVARERFGFRCQAGCNLYVDDGRVFVRKQGRRGARYDLILVDAFDVKYIPEHMLTREFMRELRTILAPGGMLAANTFSNRALQPYEVATYQSVFGPTLAVETGVGNRIILAGRDRPPSLSLLRANAAEVGPRIARFEVTPDWLLSRARPQRPLPGIAPLTDLYSPSNLLLTY